VRVASWRGALRRLAESALERRHGIATSEFLYLEDLGLPADSRVWHDPSNFLALRKALTRLDVAPDDVFADIGSGLGRAVVVAASLPFRRVIGVEVSEEMTARARENLARNRGQVRARAVELVTADALTWTLPDDLSVAYLYCPFTGDVFDAVIRRLITSVDEHPRPLRVVYNYPVEHARLLATGRVSVIDVASSQWPPTALDGPHVIVTYLLLPSNEALREDLRRRFPEQLAGAEVWRGPHEPGYQLEKPPRLGGVVLDRPADADSAGRS